MYKSILDFLGEIDVLDVFSYNEELSKIVDDIIKKVLKWFGFN